MTDDDPLMMDSLRAALQLACKLSHVPKILQGRSQVKKMPRDWVLQHIEQAVADALDLNDYWDYRRLLEVLIILESRESFRRYIAQGLASTDYDIREAAEDFSYALGEPKKAVDADV